MVVTLWRSGECVSFAMEAVGPLLAAIALVGGPVLELSEDGTWYEDDIADEVADALWLWRASVAVVWGDSWLADADFLSWFLTGGGFGVRQSPAPIPASLPA